MDRMNFEEALELYGDAQEEDNLYTALSFDPGGTTGWSIIAVHPEAVGGDPDVKILDNVEFWTCGELIGSEFDQVDEMVELVERWPAARLVIEDFVLRVKSPDKGILSPVRITFGVELGCRPRYFVKQAPALAMSTITDDRQKEMGFWVPGKPHARDATKHSLTFLKRMRERAIAGRRLAVG